MTQEKSDYYDLQTELIRMYHRKRNFGIVLSISIIFGIMAIVYSIRENRSPISIIIAGLFAAFMVFFILALSIIVWPNMNQSDYEERMVTRGIEYLSERRLSRRRVEVIGKRAEIGSSALSSRTILPLSAIPFLITYFSGQVSSETQLFIALVIILIGSSFILELDRANLDVLIRQIYVSYIPAKRERKIKKK